MKNLSVSALCVSLAVVCVPLPMVVATHLTGFRGEVILNLEPNQVQFSVKTR